MPMKETIREKKIKMKRQPLLQIFSESDKKSDQTKTVKMIVNVLS